MGDNDDATGEQAKLRPHYGFIVCGSGSSGSVVARRLAENPATQVLLLEAGGDDDVRRRPQPPPQRPLDPMNMGKVLGGGSRINVMVWSRGHRNDSDYFASEAGDPRWGYEAVLDIYRAHRGLARRADPHYFGTGGTVFVQPAPDPNPVAPALISAAAHAGIPAFDHPNGKMMEGEGGAAIADIRVSDGVRQSVFRFYLHPYMDRPNLTVLTESLVTRVTLDGRRATGVEFVHDGQTHRIGATSEVVLGLGAITRRKC